MSRLRFLYALGTLGTLLACGSDKTTGPVDKPEPVVDNTPPSVAWFIGPNTPVSPGIVADVRFRASDSSGVKRASIYFAGAFEYVDSAEFDVSWKDVEVTWSVWVPNEAVHDGNATAVVVVGDVAGNTTEAVTTIAIKDFR